MKKTLSTWLLLAPLAVSLILAGCDTTGSNGAQPELSVSFVAKSSSSAAKSSSGAALKSNHVTITSAKMLLRKIEFSNDIEDDGLPDDSLEFETGPFVVALNLDGSVNTVAVNNVPVGQYDEIEFDVHKPEDNETPPDPDFKVGTSGDERFSVIIQGTYNGEEFTYRSSENMEQELELSTPLNITEDTDRINVTLTVNLSEWFVDENNNPLDPTLVDNENAIDESIKRSFEDAFEDDDEDGEED
ncbi:hypothetical protein G3570_01440 [Balneolaceae bacterium YR4-1]|uniref:DUF4382 domain-containing protein n=1 Tax=Halalkalibaculum roseum TaxID=2709311 RepID=A0A6M1SIX1_9BACT|nr:hypothetical protein [Halalkalibaculum roseum]NGP75281.1 hypothetical protein [Halalkalibaculum roseum]